MKKYLYQLAKFLYGRNLIDQLNKHILYISIFLSFIMIFKPNIFLLIINYLLLIIFIYRFLSKNIVLRRIENDKYLAFISIFKKRYKVIKNNLTNKQSKYFICPNCKQIVRVPKGKGKIDITCPSCKNIFTKKS